jgi:predicted metalloprotease with PDZ domain
LLDLGIRYASENRAGLDDVMRRLNQDFARQGRFYTLTDLISAITQLAPSFDTGRFFKDYVQGTQELDYSTYLGYAGLRLRAAPPEQDASPTERIEEDPNARPDQLRVREGWLKGVTDPVRP